MNNESTSFKKFYFKTVVLCTALNPNEARINIRLHQNIKEAMCRVQLR